MHKEKVYQDIQEDDYIKISYTIKNVQILGLFPSLNYQKPLFLIYYKKSHRMELIWAKGRSALYSLA